MKLSILMKPSFSYCSIVCLVIFLVSCSEDQRTHAKGSNSSDSDAIEVAMENKSASSVTAKQTSSAGPSECQQVYDAYLGIIEQYMADPSEAHLKALLSFTGQEDYVKCSEQKEYVKQFLALEKRLEE